jgi:ferredoxin-like protein FixX
MTFREKLNWVSDSIAAGIITDDQAKEQATEFLADYLLQHPDLLYKGAHDSMIKLTGKESCFRCSCGCNVFRQNNLIKGMYKCNGCGIEYKGV